MADKEFILPWIKKAENDISAARHLAENMHPAPAEIICFHCQQAAEKYLKAFLVQNDYEPPKTHDLIELAKLCNGFNSDKKSDFLILLPRCEYLNPFASHTRYPGVSDPENEDIKRSLIFTNEIIEFVKSRLSF